MSFKKCFTKLTITHKFTLLEETVFLPKKRASQSSAFSSCHKSSKRTYNTDFYFLIWMIRVE